MGTNMTKEKPFSATFKLDKETKNTVRYAEERRRTGGRWWERCTSINTSCPSNIRRGFA
jgi:hypothetical protein